MVSIFDGLLKVTVLQFDVWIVSNSAKYCCTVILLASDVHASEVVGGI